MDLNTVSVLLQLIPNFSSVDCSFPTSPGRTGNLGGIIASDDLGKNMMSTSAFSNTAITSLCTSFFNFPTFLLILQDFFLLPSLVLTVKNTLGFPSFVFKHQSTAFVFPFVAYSFAFQFIKELLACEPSTEMPSLLLQQDDLFLVCQ